jgi:hypothetical protein
MCVLSAVFVGDWLLFLNFEILRLKKTLYDDTLFPADYSEDLNKEAHTSSEDEHSSSLF